MKRKIIKIDEDKCNGCGLCIPNCPEGALQIIDGKARLVSDLFCDGLGACIGHCPEGAIEIEEREAEKYDEKKVMQNIITAGDNTIKAHLEHLKEHGEHEYLSQAIDALNEAGVEIPKVSSEGCAGSCPGAKEMDFRNTKDGEKEGDVSSQLRQWPVQMHLINPQASFFQNADVALVADCVAFSLGDFHQTYLKGKSIGIACPKLDSEKEIYVEKIISWIDDAKINTLTVLTMEVPCCGGLLQIAKQAASQSKRKIPLKHVVVGIKGDVLSEEWT